MQEKKNYLQKFRSLHNSGRTTSCLQSDQLSQTANRYKRHVHAFEMPTNLEDNFCKLK